MRKEINLPQNVIDLLKAKAQKKGLKLKPYLEFKLTELANKK